MNNQQSKPFATAPTTPGMAMRQSANVMPPTFHQSPVQQQPGQTSPPMQEQLSNLYPEIYYDLNPLVVQAAEDIMASGITLTAEMLDTVVDNIIKNSGMWYEDDDDDGDIEIMPVQFRYGRPPYRRRRRRYHNRNTLRDIIRILLLQQLFGGGRGFF